MHLTVRMAWHDNNWNGKVCCNPEGNTYCTGAHSLLSGRIEKKKNTELEQSFKGLPIAGNFEPHNVPPCYWSINAFGESAFEVEHHHAFKWVKHVIPEKVKPYSVFTWPFKLSFVHNEKNKKSHGNYPPRLDKRIDNFINQFTPKESIIFFYANYDNPVSADDMKYLLMGCSVINETPVPTQFPFSDEEMNKVTKPKKKKNGKLNISMKNFPKINWALQFTHDPEKAVLLPYKPYIQYAEDFPDDEEKLHDMKVIIEEESLIQGFKYVAMDIDDDKCLYLLYKIRKSIKKIQSHDHLVVKDDLQVEEEKINAMIKQIWEKRGIYPSLDKVLLPFLDTIECSQKVASIIKSAATPKNDLLQIFEAIKEEEIDKTLEEVEDELLELSDNRLFRKNYKSLAKLALFNFTQNQVNKIIENVKLLQQLESNPYALYEEYKADEDDLDEPKMQDEAIDVYRIDVGMIPDRKHVKRHRGLQRLREDSPERIRSVIINYLRQIGEQGHCYDHTYNLLSNVKEHPLIYKNDITIDDQALIDLDADYKSHFLGKLHLESGENLYYFYLKSIRNAEILLKKVIVKLIDRPKHSGKWIDAKGHIEKSLASKELSNIITTEEKKGQFREERTQLYTNVFKQSFFLLTGKPGAGKTFETSKVIQHLSSLNEEIEILAPTGKAALRLTDNIRNNTGITNLTAKTIDKYIFENNFGWAYEDIERLEELPENEKLTLENLIIDESSMIDLQKLNILFSIIKFNEKYPKRIIMVGDENQLPPIGFGKPFHDVITFIMSKEKYADQHYIHLKSNCRQENDQNILTLAEAFTDRKRYYEEAFEIIEKEQDSKGLVIRRWKNEEELNGLINQALNGLFDSEEVSQESNAAERLNGLFGLYENGYVKNPKNEVTEEWEWKKHLKIESFQLLTPYRTGYYGTIGLNKLIQNKYRDKPANASFVESAFYHADKIIRISNWYKGWGANRRLALSNGSIGIVNGNEGKRKYFFRESDIPHFYIDTEENFDLAYSITVHKSQGSDFRNVFLVIPKKESLLSKELLYTALTRSKFRLFLFIQNSKNNLLLKARNKSHLLTRNTSVFTPPEDFRKKLLPNPNDKPVKSRIEFIIYMSLQKSGLDFKYEEKLVLDKRSYDIHPDFTIYLKGQPPIYWEHLGMLDRRKYYKDWQNRKKDYQDHGFFERVISTDDLEGINQNKIDQVIMDLREGNLRKSEGSKFSDYHYELYF